MNMRIRQFESYEEMSRHAAFSVAAQICQKPDSVLGLATGSTPIGLYEKLVGFYREGFISFRDVKTFNLDEYYGLPTEHPESYHSFMERHLFSKIDVLKKNTHLMDGCAASPEDECRRYEKKVASAGGIDLQILGIGLDGHIGFNEPDDQFSPDSHMVELDASTREANARFFGGSAAGVPAYALTMGMRCIMGARRVLLISSGEKKRDILKKALSGPICPEVPASILQLHSNVDVMYC